MTKALIIGSGPAAAGAALALSRENLEITVVDIGLRLETERQQLVDILATSDPHQWDAPLVENISERLAGERQGAFRRNAYSDRTIHFETSDNLTELLRRQM